MYSLLLSAHIVAGILFVGPVAVAASLFPRYAPVDGRGSADVAGVLYRITRVYGLLALAVPVVGVILALTQSRLGDLWVIVAMVLTAVAGALLALSIAPTQRAALHSPGENARLRRLGMTTGMFNLLWVVVVVLMIVRPT